MEETTLVLNQNAIVCFHVGCADGSRHTKSLRLRSIYDKGAGHLKC